jgi:hypothetical protein
MIIQSILEGYEDSKAIPSSIGSFADGHGSFILTKKFYPIGTVSDSIVIYAIKLRFSGYHSPIKRHKHNNKVCFGKQ